MAALGIPTALASSGYLSAAVGAPSSDSRQQAHTLSIGDFGAVGDGRADDTKAFQAAIDRLTASGGGTLFIPPGSFRTTTVRYPYEPTIIRTIGAGIGRTIWEMAAPGQPIIAIDPRNPPRRSMSAHFEGFSIRAHAEGRTDDDSMAIDCVGFSNATFESLQYLSNGKGSVGSWFHTSAHPHLTYHQRFANLVCQKAVGPGRILRTTTAGSAETNANILTIDGFWIYANDGMDTAFDLSNATTYTLRSGLIEACGGDGIRLGNAGLVESVWIESMKGAPIVFGTGPSLTASHNILRNLYLSGFGGEIVIPRSCANNILANVTGGNFRIRREDLLAGNIVVNCGAPRAAPSVSQFAGPSGKLVVLQAARVSGLGERWQLLCEFAPRGAGPIGLRVAAPVGSQLTSLQVSALVTASGAPCPSAAGWPIGDLFMTAPDARPISVVLQISLE